LTWGDELRAARLEVDVSRKSLARLAGVSTATVKAYEDGTRNPSRTMLCALLEALKVERRMRNHILLDAGFAPDGQSLGSSDEPGYMFSAEEATAYLEEFPWPAFILNEFAEVVGCNRIAERLWGIDLEREFPDPIDRSLLAIASNPRFADKVENWDDMMRLAISIFKGHHRGPEDLDRASPYFSQVMQRFVMGDPRYVRRFMELWQETQPRAPKVRWSYPVIWREPDVGVVRFQSFVSTANEPDGLAFNDWVPMDACSWECLAEILKRR
jgi:transcriptional regulator with XRE-family HTH domain